MRTQPMGALATLTAVNAETGDQVTTYTYGTTLSESEVATSTLLRKVACPDSTGDSDTVKYAYNRQAERTTITDQRGCARTLDYDKLARPIQDRVTTLGSGVDGAVRWLSASYEVRGLVEKLTSHDDPTVGQGGIVNEVPLEYNDFSQATHSYQSHSGAVNTMSTPKVQYGYENGSANTVRPTTMTYPDGRVLTYDYGTTNAKDDAASRVFALVDDDVSSTHLAEYEYLGMGIFIEVDYTEPDVRCTLIGTAGGNDPDTGDIAAQMEKSESAVGGLLTRGLKQLRGRTSPTEWSRLLG